MQSRLSKSGYFYCPLLADGDTQVWEDSHGHLMVQSLNSSRLTPASGCLTLAPYCQWQCCLVQQCSLQTREDRSQVFMYRMLEGTKAWNNTVPFRSSETFGIAGLTLGFSFLCLNEWQLHPSSWVKSAIYKSFSTFFLSLASWPNFLLPFILPSLPFGSIYSSPSLPPPPPPWSVLLSPPPGPRQ